MTAARGMAAAMGKEECSEARVFSGGAWLLILALVGGELAIWTGRAESEGKGTPELTRREIARALRHSPLGPLPDDPTNRVADDPRAIQLGQMLFFDPRLSGAGEISCATCHHPELALADGLPLAQGVETASRHTPALWNVGFNRWFFWDGRADSLWSQALDPIENPAEMAGSRTGVFRLLVGDPGLRKGYEDLFGSLPSPETLEEPGRFPRSGRPGGIPTDPQEVAWQAMSPTDRDLVNRVFANVGKLIAAYERRLVSRDAPFDRFVLGLRGETGGDPSALSASARRGLKLFLGKGNCHSCHVGPNFTDGEFHDLGLPAEDADVLDPGRFEGVTRLLKSPFRSSGPYSDAPEGKAARRLSFLAQRPEQFGEFKTPTLRNVAKTPPYMHRGQFESLEEVVRFYSTLDGSRSARHHRESILVPLQLTDEEIRDLVAFLHSLTCLEIDPNLLQPLSSEE